MYDYDSFGTLVGASLDMSECLFKTPDIIGNVYRDRDARGRVYDRSGRLLKDEKNYYRYDGEGNLILKSTRNVLEPPVMPQPKDWLDKLFTRTTPNDKELLTHYVWQQGDTAYEWYGNGMLKSVRTPDGATIRFEYDALGRRTLKEMHDTCHRYAWDGNVLLHEWSYDRREKPRTQQDELGRIHYDRQEPYTNLITWVYDGGSYTPVAKLTEDDSYTIVQDYLGTPIQALDSKGNVVWDCILDIYGDVLELRGKRDFIPFRFQGQYEDQETGLYYNRFRYYSPQMGMYISSDPIGLAGNNPTLYGYVEDVNSYLDLFGLEKCALSASDMKKMGPAPKNMYNPHRHHIVREHAPSNWSADARKWITDSQDIIAEVGIDLNSSIENFVWASNGLGNHSKKAAKTVYDELSKVRGNPEAIKETLGSLGEIFSGTGFK